MKDCLLQTTPCEFSDMGCFDAIIKSDLPKHNRIFMSQHVGYMKSKITTLEETVGKQATTIAALTKRLDVMETEHKSSLLHLSPPPFPNDIPLPRTPREEPQLAPSSPLHFFVYTGKQKQEKKRRNKLSN